VLLKSITTTSVAEALVGIFARVGIPEKILSDQGTQLTSAQMKEVGRLLSLKPLTTTPYHPQCNGLVERFNRTLKMMLKRMCAEKPKDWDRYISTLLFAYREAPQDSLGFAPFELLYGRTVKRPLQILRQLWTKDRQRLEGFLRRGCRQNLYPADKPSITQLIEEADEKLFDNIRYNPSYPVHHLLSRQTDYSYNLCSRSHNLELSHTHDKRNFIDRMLSYPYHIC